jgi:hypothetical protein
LAQVVGEKLSGGMKESTGEDAIHRMVKAGKGPSTFPAFVDEVEAEKRRSQATAFVPPPCEPVSEEERLENVRIIREAADAARRAARASPGVLGACPPAVAREAVG